MQINFRPTKEERMRRHESYLNDSVIKSHYKKIVELTEAMDLKHDGHGNMIPDPVKQSMIERLYLNLSEYISLAYPETNEQIEPVNFNSCMANDNSGFWDGYLPPPTGRFNCAGDYIWPTGEITRKDDK